MEPSMEGGVGAGSYAKNSSFQASAFSQVFPAIKNAILMSAKMNIKGLSTIRVADLGCSSGPNTVLAIDRVVKAFMERFRLGDQPEFQAFFSDIMTTDFNTLFQDSLAQNKTGEYFVAGVPGSFYERLFPSSSIHFAMSNVALHFMSKAPDHEGLSIGLTPAHRAEPEAAKAYQQQAHKDFLNFLNCRAEELVPGGILCLLMNGRKESVDNDQSDPDLLDWLMLSLKHAWEEMILEGLMDQGTMDTFAVPCFHRSKEDVMEGIQQAGSFNVLHLELVETRMPGYDELKQGPGGDKTLTTEEHARNQAMFVRSTSKPLVEIHLKNEALTEALYKRLELQLLQQEPVPSRHLLMWFVILQRL